MPRDIPIGLEIFIMISPFAAYFYSLYSPIINFLYASKYTSWLTEFFLPHFVFIDNPMIKLIGMLQLFTFFSGLFLFFYMLQFHSIILNLQKEGL